MADKGQVGVRLPSDTGENFDRERDILTGRPDVAYEPGDLSDPDFTDPLPVEETEPTIQRGRELAKAITEGYKALSQIATIAQRKLDTVVGKYQVYLDPVVDAAAIAALQRAFPNKTDYSTITYEDYKASLDTITKSAPAVITPSVKAIADAKKNPTKTDFGGYGSKPGSLRPNMDKASQPIKPVDQKDFQEKALIELFKLLGPLDEIRHRKLIEDHKKQTTHSGV